MAVKSWKDFGSQSVDLRDESGSLNEAVVSSVLPQWMIKCEDFFDSDVEGFDGDSTPCLWVKVGASRKTTYDAGGELTGDGKITSRSVIVSMKYGSWAPLIQQYMYEGKNVKALSLIRFSCIEGTKVIIQQIDYTVCKIEQYVQDGDVITFAFNFVKVVDTNTAYGTDGTKIGNTAVVFDSSSVKVELK